MTDTYKAQIDQRKSRLAEYLEGSLKELAQSVAKLWSDHDELGRLLRECLVQHPVLKRCKRLYVLDKNYQQVSANVSHDEIDASVIGQDLSQRPYFSDSVPEHGLKLSAVYVDRISGHSCITAIYVVSHGDVGLGYLLVDFELLSLPSVDEDTEDRRIWLQIKGDPSIRGTLFMQSRTQSLMDEELDNVIGIVEELLLSHGVFHAKLHFSSSRVTLWLYDSPYHYRIHALDEIKEACLAYKVREYPKEATVSKEQIPLIFEQFRTLRFADDTVYLRAASLNIINGMVALNFSCDGTHYIPAEEFITKGDMFWLGAGVS